MDPLSSFNPNSSLGAFQIGVLVSYALFGVTTTQSCLYYSRFPDDSRGLKTLVAFVWFCEFAHAVCIGHGLYTYTISNYGNPQRLAGALPKSLATAVLFAGIIAASVQGFFTFRIYAFSKQVYIPLFISVMVFVRLLAGLAVFVTALKMSSLAQTEAQCRWLLPGTWAVSSVNDLTITATLVVVLFKERTHVVHTRTAALVDKLIAWTIETGMLTSISGIFTLACYFTMKDNFVWLAVFMITARLFANNILASLNSRATLRAMAQATMTRPSLTPATELVFTGTDMQTSKITQMTYDHDDGSYGGPDNEAAPEAV
ncbi:hypothetical protein MVEN_00214200 [Mycena venus]|uniref:DUF6534 domain-containing protein n=1 Tax=Mycena venus TaxID=2733690 RepID=A0A8H6Z1S4_9AGAR|nr:hypothetical protein MVEN_00214200 [Mycena venus]